MTARLLFSWPWTMRTICALAATAWLPLAAAQSQTSQPAASGTVPAKALPAGWVGQRIVLDPVTRRPRVAEHDEVQLTTSAVAAGTVGATGGLEAQPLAARLMARPRAAKARMGATVHPMDPGTLSFQVARRTAEGGLISECVEGEEAAQAALQGASQGERHDH